MISIKVQRPITNVSLISGHNDSGQANREAELEEARKSIAIQHQQLAGLCTLLEQINHKMDEACSSFINTHSEEIAKLSVEIARKILTGKIDKNDYRIEEIVKQTLSEVPDQIDIEIHLNPSDVEILKVMIDAEDNHPLAGHSLVGDHSVGKAECEIVGPRGKVRSMINEKLEQIEELLRKA